MQRVLAFLVFLTLIAENKAELIYSLKWETPLRTVYDILFFRPALVPLFDFVLIGFLIVSRNKPGARTGRVKQLDRALVVAIGTIALSIAWGLVRGGNARQMFHQLHGFLQMLLFSALFVSVFKSRRDFEILAKAILAAAFWRAGMVLIFRYVVLKVKNITPIPPTMTTHSDTVLFVTGFMLVVLYALETRTTKAKRLAICSLPLLLWAIELNGRRLAYVSLVASLLTLYLFMPKGRIKRTLNRGLLYAAPMLVLYVALGWNSSSAFFKPVRSFSTMAGEKEDSSSQTRNIENYNLIVTLRQNPLLGTGWGHEYTEVSVAHSIVEFFEQYRFIPHNSVLGMVAFGGLIGMLGMWMPFPIVVFLGSRTYLFAKDPIMRVGGLTAGCIPLIYVVQLYGDMGMVSYTAALIMGSASAAASRYSILAGVLQRPAAIPLPAQVGKPTEANPR